MRPKADTPVPPTQLAETGVSGKLVIIGILTLAIVAAGGSWMFRYNATHHAASFWGSNAWLIRDGENIELLELRRSKGTSDGATENTINYRNARYEIVTRYEVSKAPGMAHLRNAMLEDLSFIWPAERPERDPDWRWVLEFRQEKEGCDVFFTEDCELTSGTNFNGSKCGVASCAPIAAGLREMFAEFASDAAPSTSPANSTR
jgi:hypothetical protein